MQQTIRTDRRITSSRDRVRRGIGASQIVAELIPARFLVLWEFLLMNFCSVPLLCLVEIIAHMDHQPNARHNHVDRLTYRSSEMMNTCPSPAIRFCYFRHLSIVFHVEDSRF